MSRYGGYRGGKPASEMGPPAKIPSGFISTPKRSREERLSYTNREQEACKAFSMYGIDEAIFKLAALQVALIPDDATPEEIVNIVLAAVAGHTDLVRPFTDD